MCLNAEFWAGLEDKGGEGTAMAGSAAEWGVRFHSTVQHICAARAELDFPRLKRRACTHTNTHQHTRLCAHLDRDVRVCVAPVLPTKNRTTNSTHSLAATSPSAAGVSLARRTEGKSECVLTNHSLLLPRGGSRVREPSEECRDWITGEGSEHTSDNVSVTVKRDREKPRRWRAMKGEWTEEIDRWSEMG